MTAAAGRRSAAAELPAPAAEFLCYLANERRSSPRTIEAYGADLRQLADLHPGADLLRLAQADIRRALARLHAGGLAPASLARVLSAWRSFYRWLGERQLVAANPAVGVRAPRRAKRLPKALAVDDAVRLAALAPTGTPLALRDRAMVELLYSSGLRLAELVGLDWRYHAREGAQPASAGWLDLDAREVIVTGKGAKTRSVPVGAAAVAALRDWLPARAALAPPPTRALFVSARGTRISARSVEARVARLARLLGLGVHVHPHALRHSMASHLLQSSGDLRAVQELLGHASIATTQIYTQLDWQHLAKAYDAAHPRAKRRR
jgi:integrase/recombinase XerC